MLAPLPGWDAQRQMINYSRPRIDDVEKIDPQARRGAVLLLLYPKEGKDYLVLTLRNTYEGIHSGQVSLPGGKMEETDRDLVSAALRESHEEVGVDPKKVQILGSLSPIYIPPSRFLVYPFVGHTEHAPNFHADPVEVAEIIETPLEVLLNRRYRKEKPLFVRTEQAEIPVKYFDIAGHVVWGATAMILSEFAEILKRNNGAT